MDVFKISTKFKTEKDCHQYLIKERWGKDPCCPFCDSKNVYQRNTENRLFCAGCNSSFSATSGTIFHSTKTPLRKWFMAAAMITSAKKGISSLQLSRTIGVNKNTAWYMQKRLREAMKEDLYLNGLVEETYPGGALGNTHTSRKKERNPHLNGMLHYGSGIGYAPKTW